MDLRATPSSLSFHRCSKSLERACLSQGHKRTGLEQGWGHNRAAHGPCTAPELSLKCCVLRQAAKIQPPPMWCETIYAQFRITQRAQTQV